MFEDLLLLLAALVGAASVNVGYKIDSPPLIVVCALLFTTAVFWMGVRAGRRE
jgi:hypothetical protein